MCFLDTNAFTILLRAVDKNDLPPDTLSESLLSPVTALECAQHPRHLQILARYSGYLRPLHSRFIRTPDGYDDFVNQLSREKPRFFKGWLDALHVQCVMYPSFLRFHMSRYRERPPKGIAGSQRLTSDVRDSMQLIISQEIPFLTCDRDIQNKLPPGVRCRVIYSEPRLELVVAAMRLINSGRDSGLSPPLPPVLLP